MGKRIGWTSEAKTDLRAIGRNTAMEILHGLARFVSTERGDVKKLRDVYPAQLRLRVGDYRVRFYDHGDWIEILGIKHRENAYR